MDALFAWLDRHFSVFSQREDEIRILSAMRQCDTETFRLAGQYFPGFISEADRVTALKCHYLCKCRRTSTPPGRAIMSSTRCFSIRVWRRRSEKSMTPLLLPQIGDLMAWDDARPRFYCAGLALDDRDRLSINFYFQET